MTTPAHFEAETTRALWRRFLRNSEAIITRAGNPNQAFPVGRVVRLLREQKRILNELIPEEEP